MTVPSIGDILLLSQVAWKISRAFSAGRKNAPTEFQEVETEIGGLAKTLKHLAEAIHADADQGILQEVEEEVQHGFGRILFSCQRTVNDLDSLIDQYQVIKKHRTVGGFAIERTWSDLVLAEFKTIIWTTEGGNIQNLKNLLQMHTSSITLVIHALQSQSKSRLENVVFPMADRIDSIHQADVNINQQVEDVCHLVQDLMVSDEVSKSPPIPVRNPARSPTIRSASFAGLDARPAPPPIGSPSSIMKIQPNTTKRPKTPDLFTSSSSDDMQGQSSPSETMTSSRATSPTRKRVSEFSFGGSSLRYSSSSYASSTASSGGWSQPGTPRDSFVGRHSTTSTKMTSPLPRTPEVREPDDQSSDAHLPLLPPPAMGYSAPYEVDKHGARSMLSPYPTTQPEITKLHRSSTTSSQKAAFEKEAFRNGAILCDVHGKLVEYSHQINEDDPRDVEMLQAADDCRIAVVRKRIHDMETKAVRVVTSIWAFSDDNTVRVELRMDDQQMYIPYSSYFSPTKVSITVPCVLKFHDVRHGNRPAKLAKTSWVNYVFDTPQGAALFQNELMGRTLLATFRTEKTMRIHEGLGKSFSYAEQMCGLENLRVWEDNDTGAIIALIHFSADFRKGYLAFYINSSVNPIKVKDDGAREVKIKGLRVPIDRGDRAMRKDSFVATTDKGKGKAVDLKKVEKEKVISGAKIEFASDMEKKEFLAMVKEMQRELIELPDLLGVN